MKIIELTLFTNKLEEQLVFHSKVLELNIIDQNADSFSFRAGWSIITFSRSTTPHLYHYCYLIPTNKLEEAKEWMSRRVGLIQTNGDVFHKHDHWNAEALYFYDGGGNIAELIVRYDLDVTSEEAFNFDQVICMNEMGAPSSNISETSTHLAEKTRIKIWKGDTIRFATQGSQLGMFLLVNNTVKDKWFPTSLFPESAPFTCIIEHQRSQYSIIFDGTRMYSTPVEAIKA